MAIFLLSSRFLHRRSLFFSPLAGHKNQSKFIVSRPFAILTHMACSHSIAAGDGSWIVSVHSLDPSSPSFTLHLKRGILCHLYAGSLEGVEGKRHPEGMDAIFPLNSLFSTHWPLELTAGAAPLIERAMHSCVTTQQKNIREYNCFARVFCS